MIAGLGIDSVEIARFASWHAYSDEQLSRFFAPHEIAYCRSIPAKMAERFAVRFAAKEALLKALSHLGPVKPIALLTMARAASLSHNAAGAPTLLIDWQTLEKSYFPKLDIPYQSLVSLTHTSTTATACIILQKPTLN